MSEDMGKYAIWQSDRYGRKVIGKIINISGRTNATVEIVFPKEISGNTVPLSIEHYDGNRLWKHRPLYEDITEALLEY